jgi:HlyD family secretion protein
MLVPGVRACLIIVLTLGFAEYYQAADSTPSVRHIRATGTVQALRVSNIQVPQLRGPGGRLTLIRLIPNGSHVKPGDLIAEFDRTQQVDDARDARAKVEDLNHQIEQARAQARSDAAKRTSDLKGAEADFAKAEIELRKGEILSEIDRLKNEVKLESARARVVSLKKSNHSHDVADDAGIKILELQRDRQQVALERAEGNMEKLAVKSNLGGMIALEMQWRNGSMGPMQEGDQSWPGQPLVRIFDPTDMVVITQVNEPDGAAITPATRAKIRLDAYPGVLFDAHFESASPVASSGINSPIKFFSVRFRLDQHDPRLLPDLSAAVEIEAPAPGSGQPESKSGKPKP